MTRSGRATTVPIAVRLDLEDAAQVEALAARLGVSRAEAARRLVEAGLGMLEALQGE